MSAFTDHGGGRRTCPQQCRGSSWQMVESIIGTPLQTNLICPIGCVQAQIEKDIKSWHDCIAAIMPGAACFVNSPGYPGQVVGVSLAPLSGVVPV